MGVVTKLLEFNESKFLSWAKEVSEKKTKAQEKMILIENNCRIRVRAWKKVIALKIWLDVTSQNKNKNVESKLYDQRYIISEESILFSSYEAKLNFVFDKKTLWQFSVVKSFKNFTFVASMLELLKNLFRDKSLMTSKIDQEEHGVAITLIVDDILSIWSR